MAEIQAAPPDAGGHLGAFARPDEVMTRVGPSQGSGESAGGPPLHRMQRPGKVRRHGAWPLVAVIIVALGFIAVFALGLVPLGR